MTIYDQFELKVNLVSYKPSWKFKIIYQGLESGHEAIQLFVTYKTQDIVTQEWIDLSRYFGISEFVVEELVKDKELFSTWIRRCIYDMEMHEIDELLKFEGKCIREPHPEINKEPKPSPVTMKIKT